jgi:hypothetical protein
MNAYLFTLLTTVFLVSGCQSPQHEIIPIIYDSHDRIGAMKSAPIIVLAEVQQAELLPGGPREVQKPLDVAGPLAPRIPLYLADMSATVVLTMRGAALHEPNFYSWVWHSGSHGGPRLFHPNQGSFHILFLRRVAGYLRTVGDYPNYDLEIDRKTIGPFLSAWQSGYGRDLGLMERITAVRIKTYLENIPGHTSDHSSFSTYELTALTSTPFVAGKVEFHCQHTERKPELARECLGLKEMLR